MSEKRFEKSKSDITDYRIYDYEKEDAYFIDCDDESTVDAIVGLLNEQQATIQSLKERLYDFEKRKIIEESEIDEDVIPKVKLLRAELFGEKYE